MHSLCRVSSDSEEGCVAFLKHSGSTHTGMSLRHHYMDHHNNSATVLFLFLSVLFMVVLFR